MQTTPTNRLEISEIRPDEYDAVQALLRGDADQPEDSETPPQPAIECFPRCKSVLSLVARDNGRLIGAILCYHDSEQGYSHQVAIAPSHTHTGLGKTLIDKALRKLKIQGANKCRISLPADIEGHPFWETLRWASPPDLAQTPMRSSAVTDRLAAQQATPAAIGTDPDTEKPETDAATDINDDLTDTPDDHTETPPPQSNPVAA